MPTPRTAVPLFDQKRMYHATLDHDKGALCYLRGVLTFIALRTGAQTPITVEHFGWLTVGTEIRPQDRKEAA